MKTQRLYDFNGRSSGSNWCRYVSTIFQGIFCGDIPLHSPAQNRPVMIGIIPPRVERTWAWAARQSTVGMESINSAVNAVDQLANWNVTTHCHWYISQKLVPEFHQSFNKRPVSLPLSVLTGNCWPIPTPRPCQAQGPWQPVALSRKT